MPYELNLLNNPEILDSTQSIKPEEWSHTFAKDLYIHVADNSLYITNIAKRTQVDARKLTNSVSKDFIPAMLSEIKTINPKVIISFGNHW